MLPLNSWALAAGGARLLVDVLCLGACGFAGLVFLRHKPDRPFRWVWRCGEFAYSVQQLA